MKYIRSILIIIFLLFGYFYSNSQQKNKKIPIVIDSDTANEIDDLFALVRAVQEPKLNVLGITSAQFHTSPLASDSSVRESQAINKELVNLLNRSEIPLPMGSNVPLENNVDPAESEAADFIITNAHNMSEGQKLHLVILGPCTNVASAILKDASIIPKIQVYYIGFWHDVAPNTYDKNEFNSQNDYIAVNLLLNTKGLDFSVMTATTSQNLVFEKADVFSRLKGKGDISDYLVDRWENYDRWWTDEDPEKERWIMWDLAIIEALIHPELAEKSTFMTPKENEQRSISIYTALSVEEMISDFWQSILKE